MKTTEAPARKTELPLPRIYREAGVEVQSKALEKDYAKQGFTVMRGTPNRESLFLVGEAEQVVVAHIEDLEWKLSGEGLLAMREQLQSEAPHYIRSTDKPLFHLRLLRVKSGPYDQIGNLLCADSTIQIESHLYDADNQVADFTYTMLKK